MRIYIDKDRENYFGINKSEVKTFGVLKSIARMTGLTRHIQLFVGDETMIALVLFGRDILNNFGLKTVEEVSSCNKKKRNSLYWRRGDKRGRDNADVNTEVEVNFQNRLKKLFWCKYLESKNPKEPKTKVELRLSLRDHQPFHFSPRRLSYSEKGDVRKMLDQFCHQGYVQESDSKYASPIVLTWKKNADPRMCVDFRTLNKLLPQN